MPQIPAYQDPERRARLLSARRRGATLAQAAETIGAQLVTLLGWIDRDPVLAHEIEEAGRGIETRPEPSGLHAQRWAKMREEAARLAPGMLGLLLYVDGLLAMRPGAHALSPYWRWVLGEWYASGKPVFLGRLGRGAAKSTSQTKVVVTECVFGERSVPPGETWIWPFLSFDMSESNLKFGPLESALRGIGYGSSDLVVHRRKDGRSTIGFEDHGGNAIEVRVYPNTITAMSGPTLAGATDDEEAKWKSDKDKGLNSAEEVLDAMAGAFRGDAKSRKHMRISSAYQTRGPHYDDIEAGDNELHFIARLGPFVAAARAGFELVAERLEVSGKAEDAAKLRAYSRSLTEASPNIPSWVGNPSHDVWGGFLRARQRVTQWMRENGSVSTAEGDDDGEFFDGELLIRAAALPVPGKKGECFAALDPASRKNACTLAIVCRVELDERVLTLYPGGRWQVGGWLWIPVVLRQWIPSRGAPLDLRMRVLPEAAALARAHGCELWVTDVHALSDVEIVGNAHGLATRCRSEGDAHELEARPVRDAIHRGEVCLSGCEGAAELVEQLRGVRSKISGDRIVMAWPEIGDLHGDLARAFVSAAAEAGAGTLRADSDTAGISTMPGRYSSVDPRRG